MIKYLIGALLTTTMTLAQIAQQPAKNASSTKPTPGATAASASTSATAPKSASASEPLRPLPEHSLETKLQSESSVNPNYRKEKARGRGTKRDYTPRRTASGARKDTMNQRKP